MKKQWINDEESWSQELDSCVQKQIPSTLGLGLYIYKNGHSNTWPTSDTGRRLEWDRGE